MRRAQALSGLRRRAQRWLRSRQRAQDLVEFGVAAAAVALVGLVGLNLLSAAQKTYFTGQGAELNPAPPSAPGALMHPTSVDTPSCTPSVIDMGATLTCSGITVRDTFTPATDRYPPWGTVVLYAVDSSGGRAVFGSCALPSIGGTAAQNSCAGSVSGPMNVPGTFTIVASYQVPNITSNHMGSDSVPFASVLVVRYKIATAPDPRAPSCASAVEIGHPVECTGYVIDASTGGGVPGAQIQWAAGGQYGAGQPYLSCSTANGLPIQQVLYTSGACTPSTSITCTTDASGKCTIVFRRIRESAAWQKPIDPGTQDLQLTPVVGGVAYTPVVASRVVTIVNTVSGGAHWSWTWMNCTAAGPNIWIDPDGVVTIPTTLGGPRYATYRGTVSIHIHGSGPTVSGSLKCTQTIVDADPSADAPLDCQSPPTVCAAPDSMDGHAASGTVQWSLNGTVVAPACTLSRLDVVPSTPAQAPNQTPYASSCTDTFTISGPVASTASLTAAYVSTLPLSGGTPDHRIVADSSGNLGVPVTVSFEP